MSECVTELKVTIGLLAKIAGFYINGASNRQAVEEIQRIEAQAKELTGKLATNLDHIQHEYYKQDGRGKYERQ